MDAENNLPTTRSHTHNRKPTPTSTTFSATTTTTQNDSQKPTSWWTTTTETGRTCGQDCCPSSENPRGIALENVEIRLWPQTCVCVCSRTHYAAMAANSVSACVRVCIWHEHEMIGYKFNFKLHACRIEGKLSFFFLTLTLFFHFACFFTRFTFHALIHEESG